jgi:hypothetical protein
MTIRNFKSLEARQPDQVVSPREARRAIRQQGRVEYTVFCRQVEIDMLVEFDRQDVEGTGNALEFALDQEFRLIDRARADAHGDPVKLELAARKIDYFAASNNARARRRFGRLG